MRACWILAALSLGCGVAFEGGGTAASNGSGTPASGSGGDNPTTGSGASGALGGNGGNGGGGQGAGAGGTGAGPGTGGNGGAPPCVQGTVVAATVADCILLNAPDPDECELQSGAGEMDIDPTSGNIVNNPSHGFFRFDLPPGALGATGFEVEIEAAGTSQADGPGSGEIWKVLPFVRNDLFVAAPAIVGMQPLDGDQGAVALGQLVTWQLPASTVQGGSVFLGLLPTQDNGVRYLNNNGATPPVLVVSCD